MTKDPVKRIVDLIDRLEVKIDAGLAIPEYLDRLQQELNNASVNKDTASGRYYQYALELQALINRAQGKEEDAMRCTEAAIEQAGSLKKLRSRLLKNYLRTHPLFTPTSNPRSSAGPGDLNLLSERERVFMRAYGLEGTPNVAFLIRRQRVFLGLLVISGGLYGTYWCYKNWQAIRDASENKLSPLWRTCFTIFYIWPLFKAMILLAKSRGYKVKYSAGLLAIGFIFIPLVALPVYVVSDSWILVTFLEFVMLCASLCFLVLGQEAAVFAVAKQPTTKPKYRPFNYVEWLFVTAGLLFLFFQIGGHLFYNTQPYRSIVQQERVVSAKQQLYLTTALYNSCSTDLKNTHAKLNTSDKAAVNSYNAEVKQCAAADQLRDQAQKKYTLLTTTKQ